MPKTATLENAVMDVLWSSSEPLTVRHVLERLSTSRTLAYTTVQTTMDRLARKGLLIRRPEGKANAYHPASSREDHTAALMQKTLHEAPDAEAALLHFVERIDDDQERALRAALERRQHGPRS